MITVISPAKSLDFESPAPNVGFTEPALIDQSERVMQSLRKKSVNKLMQMQDISRNLAELNYGRNQVWSMDNTEANSRQAVSAFQGDVYQGLCAWDFSEEEYQFAQDHLRILSGLYGILRPLDRIQPYRLEMGTGLRTTRGKNLYEFWKMRITDEVNALLQEQEVPVLINLASDEYFKSIKPKKVNGTIIQPVFMDKKNGKFKIISFFAKKARGLMSRYLIQNRIDEPEYLKGFDFEGYGYNAELSQDHKWVFTRDQE
ncbi:peroxide stress protein YaaA [bacterium SCSIO 12741]|nr:peroxide stress protein YaaA [bacterium SCSIO 12741]